MPKKRVNTTIFGQLASYGITALAYCISVGQLTPDEYPVVSSLQFRYFLGSNCAKPTLSLIIVAVDALCRHKRTFPGSSVAGEHDMPVTAGALTSFTVALTLVFDSAQLTSQEPADWAKHRFERDLHASSFRERW